MAGVNNVEVIMITLLSNKSMKTKLMHFFVTNVDVWPNYKSQHSQRQRSQRRIYEKVNKIYKMNKQTINFFPLDVNIRINKNVMNAAKKVISATNVRLTF